MLWLYFYYIIFQKLKSKILNATLLPFLIYLFLKYIKQDLVQKFCHVIRSFFGKYVVKIVYVKFISFMILISLIGVSCSKQKETM